jgi:hypothetical protein
MISDGDLGRDRRIDGISMWMGAKKGIGHLGVLAHKFDRDRAGLSIEISHLLVQPGPRGCTHRHDMPALSRARSDRIGQLPRLANSVRLSRIWRLITTSVHLCYQR